MNKNWKSYECHCGKHIYIYMHLQKAWNGVRKAASSWLVAPGRVDLYLNVWRAQVMLSKDSTLSFLNWFEYASKCIEQMRIQNICEALPGNIDRKQKVLYHIISNFYAMTSFGTFAAFIALYDVLDQFISKNVVFICCINITKTIHVTHGLGFRRPGKEQNGKFVGKMMRIAQVTRSGGNDYGLLLRSFPWSRTWNSQTDT